MPRPPASSQQQQLIPLPSPSHFLSHRFSPHPLPPPGIVAAAADDPLPSPSSSHTASPRILSLRQVSSLQQQLAGAEQAAALAKLAAAAPAPVLATPEKAAPSTPAPAAGAGAGAGAGDAAALQVELAKTAAQLQQATQRVAALEGERARLERDAKEMSRSLAASIHSPHSRSVALLYVRPPGRGSFCHFHGCLRPLTHHASHTRTAFRAAAARSGAAATWRRGVGPAAGAGKRTLNWTTWTWTRRARRA